MPGRRDFLQMMLALPLLGIPSLLRAETEFDQYRRAQQAGVRAIKDSWQDYRSAYLSAFRTWQRELARVWSQPEMSDKTRWVQYSADLKTRRLVDFSKNEVRLSFTGAEAMKLTDARIRAEFETLINTTVSDAWRQDPVLSVVEQGRGPVSQEPVSGLRQTDQDALLKNRWREQEETPKGEVVTIVIPLNAEAVSERAQQYLPLVRQYAARWQVDPVLVLAIMQTESAFNPMARSYVPAFGLMQIVPESAGRDASRRLWGQERLLSSAELFQPATNIELGCIYLHLLSQQYLSGVNDPQSRLYCVIAAYNTGAGNVARSFSGTTSVKDAAPRINRMTPMQVYSHLRSNLQHEEARNYLHKVTQAMTVYQA